MRSIAILSLLVAAACETVPRKTPDPTINVEKHPEYDSYRPIILALLPVDADWTSVREAVRDRIYDRLFEGHYSPLRRSEVDAHIDPQGNFSAEDIEWDATVEVTIGRWRSIDGAKYLAGGKIRMVHRSGDLIWRVTFKDVTLDAGEDAGSSDMTEVARDLVRQVLTRLPPAPPPPQD